MKSILPIAGILAASIAAAPATSIIVNTVGVVNTNNKTPILAATGNSLTVTTFASNVATAFTGNTGGVWNFDGANFGVNVGETVTLNYGTSQSNSMVMTVGSSSPTSNINQGNVAGEATSGSTELGLGGDASTRTFTLNTPLLAVGIFNLDRNDSGRTSVLTVTYQNATTASTSGANADNIFFHELSGTLANPIVSFSLTQNNFVRYDDLGFIVVPEPSSAALLGLVGFGALIRRRR